ncbi:copper-binding protein [Bradyrhizobium sp. SYSU BS000235]|uniref:copper-binding protein n=1 Tax=Bradyrhizobium sp. SYSU BS000235 TaxID=3411332 RepID=UPI003C7751C4
MTTAKTILAGTAALAILSSAAFAQDAKQESKQEPKQAAQQDSQTGILTKIDRIHGTVTIQREDKESTVGSSAGAAGEDFKAQRGLSLEDVHAGDKVKYSATGTGEGRTITKLEKQKE